METVKAVNTKTLGVSPKLPWGVLAAVLSYLLTQEIVDLPAILDLLVNALAVGLAVFIASPGTVVTSGPADPTDD